MPIAIKLCLTGQIFYAVTAYTDKLHTFIYSEETHWRKDSQGNTAEVLATEYEVVVEV